MAKKKTERLEISLHLQSTETACHRTLNKDTVPTFHTLGAVNMSVEKNLFYSHSQSQPIAMHFISALFVIGDAPA